MSARTKINLITSVLTAVMLASWFLNFGWLRFVATFLLFPLVQGGLFILLNVFSSKYYRRSKPLWIVTVLSLATFLLPHLLIPDVSDIGPTYFFFGLIQNSAAADIAMGFGSLFLLVHLGLFTAQFVLFLLVRSKTPVAKA